LQDSSTKSKYELVALVLSLATSVFRVSPATIGRCISNGLRKTFLIDA
jgi:hypothetical protein